jgi:coenzyme PQQ synthesis protein D (PqqD)
LSETLRLRPGALDWREVEGEVVAFELRTSTYLGVNKTGASVWPALAEGATRAELVARLEEKFGVDRARAEKDLDAFLETLRERDLLEG